MVPALPRWDAGAMETTALASQLLQPDAVFYLESSLPPGMTIGEYRRSRPRRPTRWERLKQLAGGGAQVAAGRPA
jgi:hypothetical protein